LPDFANYKFEKYGLDVSRETRDKFNRYAELLLKWQNTINLVSEDSLEELAERHFLDSAQVIKYIPHKQIKLADMGSGAGFPGLILAMLGVADVHLIESDVRKATFLREVSRETNTKVTVHDDRVEDITIEGLDLITARALAPLKDLLTMTKKLGANNCLFLKGEKTKEEVEKAQKRFKFDLEIHQSVTDKTGKILNINNLTDK
jgi:16S rRNA (guanine527-N7)-methyltransferase